MIRRPFALVAALAVGVTACQDSTGPTQPPSRAMSTVTSADAETGVVASATGSGHVKQPDAGIRKFTISALKRADGSVSGQYDLKSGPQDLLKEFEVSPPLLSFHGTITCMTVIGNSAYLGGTVDSHINGDLYFGTDDFTGVAIELIDNGDGPDSAPDQISSVAVYLPTTPSTPQDYCDDPAPGSVFPIEQGNISVR
ncbi:MAG: hypothetical protein PVI57_16445 [Gemmatimonadota bacterium]|jgi:hypothetical protein